MLTVTAKFKVQSGKEKEVEKSFKKALPNVEKEKDTLEYQLLRCQSDPSTFLVLEKYKDMDAFMIHGAAPYVAELINTWIPLLEGDLEILTFDTVAAKGK